MKESICKQCTYYSLPASSKMACFCNHYNAPIILDLNDDCMWFENRSLTYEDILNQFKQAYPSIEVTDYRPICHELFEKDKIGITIWTTNNDMLVYYPGGK